MWRAGRTHTHDTANGRFPQLQKCGDQVIPYLFIQHGDSYMKIIHDWATIRAC
jgi:hypothetical protein